MDSLIQDFITVWVVIDPVGSIPVFLAVVTGYSASQQRKLALTAAAVAAGILFFFILAGQVLLESMEISLQAFQIAGGIVLFLFALTMIFGESKPDEELQLVDRGMNSAVFPLAIPSIASPGAMMAVVMLTDNHRYSIAEQAITTGIMLSVIAVTLVFLLFATVIHRVIGDAGANIISRVMGLILAAVATNAILEGLTGYFGLAVA